jgi:hypothetical protein
MGLVQGVACPGAQNSRAEGAGHRCRHCCNGAQGSSKNRPMLHRETRRRGSEHRVRYCMEMLKAATGLNSAWEVVLWRHVGAADGAPRC